MTEKLAAVADDVEARGAEHGVHLEVEAKRDEASSERVAQQVVEPPEAAADDHHVIEDPPAAAALDRQFQVGGVLVLGMTSNMTLPASLVTRSTCSRG